MTVAKSRWPANAKWLLYEIAKRTCWNPPVRYEPAAWFGKRSTVRSRARWSRWTKRLASDGLVQRITEPHRDRVQWVTITPLGLEWIDEHWGLASLQPVDLGDFAMSAEDLLSPFTDRGAVVKSPTDPPTRKDLGPITSGPSGQLDLVRSVPHVLMTGLRES